ncbi:MAG: hypothetical protein LAO30_01060 [Acidobacteriia bacterium]|nr:hypothetical protein [Terriglobia bacterium]
MKIGLGHNEFRVSGILAMMDLEEKHETGASLMVVGLGMWLMDLLVVTFLPSGIVYGHRATFLGIIGAIGVLGLILLIAGYKVRGKSGDD